MFPPCFSYQGFWFLETILMIVFTYDTIKMSNLPAITISLIQNSKDPCWFAWIYYNRYLDYLSFEYLDTASLCLRRYSILWKWSPSQAGAPFCLAHSIMDYLGTNKTCNMWDTLHRSQVHAITIGVLAHTCLHTYLFNQKHQES